MRRSDDELLNKAIVVVGVGRSGMNILGELIARHGSIGTAAEPRLIWKYGNDRKSDMLRVEDARPKVVAYIRSRLSRLVRDQATSISRCRSRLGHLFAPAVVARANRSRCDPTRTNRKNQTTSSESAPWVRGN